ncbi:unnamed protein product [Acanthoscelides obtectus]|uniref:Integrase catalytic domain-containing protein n=1 Tax=Acanthoscelides obtectus TaxID=200917 RepID=A0A9P0LU02_ACAOB|nr:unnamed protein product [Acanthoscelides obtectus]CAK1639301.1 Transposon Tf2-11 polyprotein [Acanthoscelides obtectus]
MNDKMAPKKPKANVNEENSLLGSLDESESPQCSELKNMVNNLADDFKRLQTSLSEGSRQYVGLLRDLGGHTLTFVPNGPVHPMNFLRKIMHILDEAGVPETARLKLVTGCLRGSAAEWAEIKEDSFDSFQSFIDAFMDRYWGFKEQRALYYEIKYGKFRSGSRADYVLQMAKLASFLTDKISESELVRATARSIVNKLERYFSEILTPEAVLSDNGTQFHSAVYIKCLAEKGVKSIYTSVYFPSDNPTERMNRGIGRLLRCFCSTKHTEWACVLPRIEHCLNNIVHESTGQVPAMLMFGKSEPNDIFKLIDYPPGNPPTPDWTSSLQLASNNLRSKARKRKEMFENKNKAITFTVGDSVLVKTHPISSAANAEIRKLFVRFDGPYVVSRIVGPNSYMLKNIEGVNVGPQNIRNLKLYKRCPTPDQFNIESSEKNVFSLHDS